MRDALAALVKANDPATMFVHGDCLVRIDPLAPGGAIRALNKAQLRLQLSDSANWMNESKTKEGEPSLKPAVPKVEFVESIFDHIAWPGLPRLKAVVDVPVITAESGLLTEPGYDAVSGVYLLPGSVYHMPEVKEAPTAYDVEIARNLLTQELLADFPFADAASKANTLALFMLPFVRDLIDGPTPLHHIDAPKAGTGKTLLAEVWGHVAFGRDLPSLGEVSRPEEWQKLLLAALIESPRALFLDNLNAKLVS